jgi:protein Mpv17
MSTAAARVAADQLGCAPIMIGVFLSSMAVMEGVSPMQKLEGTYSYALHTNWKLWPLVQAVNLTIVPAPHRLLVVNLVNIGKFHPMLDISNGA